jgi:ferredoxin-nitrite reductase
MNDVLFNLGRGNAEFANLPRKLNICVSSTRDDFPHTQINDLGYEAVTDPASGKVVFNVVVGGYFSLKRNIMSVPLGVSVTQEQLLPFTLALLRVFRWVGAVGRRESGVCCQGGDSDDSSRAGL